MYYFRMNSRPLSRVLLSVYRFFGCALYIIDGISFCSICMCLPAVGAKQCLSSVISSNKGKRLQTIITNHYSLHARTRTHAHTHEEGDSSPFFNGNDIINESIVSWERIVNGGV